jgi:hypothetical protein
MTTASVKQPATVHEKPLLKKKQNKQPKTKSFQTASRPEIP